MMQQNDKVEHSSAVLLICRHELLVCACGFCLLFVFTFVISLSKLILVCSVTCSYSELLLLAFPSFSNLKKVLVGLSWWSLFCLATKDSMFDSWVM